MVAGVGGGGRGVLGGGVVVGGGRHLRGGGGGRLPVAAHACVLCWGVPRATHSLPVCVVCVCGWAPYGVFPCSCRLLTACRQRCPTSRLAAFTTSQWPQRTWLAGATSRLPSQWCPHCVRVTRCTHSHTHTHTHTHTHIHTHTHTYTHTLAHALLPPLHTLAVPARALHLPSCVPSAWSCLTMID